MASRRSAQQFQCLARRPQAPLRQAEIVLPLRPGSVSKRAMATVNDSTLADFTSEPPTRPRPRAHFSEKSPSLITTTVETPSDPSILQPPHTVLTTIHSFPKMEPLRFAHYPTTSLHLPLRRDILHRAVVYEGSHARQGTANTKWRDEVHGTHKKHHKQKGLGMARAGDKQSPIRRGGGVAFGPKPRDFGIGLQRKVYDLAFRTALSYRYRRGELIVVEKMRSPRTSAPYYLEQLFEANRWGNAYGRSLFVARERNEANDRLWTGIERVGREGRIVDTEKVDVKMLLEMGRVILEEEALNDIIRKNSKDLVRPVMMMGAPVHGEAQLARVW